MSIFRERALCKYSKWVNECCAQGGSDSLKSGTISSGSSDDGINAVSSLPSKSGGGSSQFKSLTSFGTTQKQIFSDIGYFRGILVALKHIRKEHIQLSRTVLLEFNEVGMTFLYYSLTLQTITNYQLKTTSSCHLVMVTAYLKYPTEPYCQQIKFKVCSIMRSWFFYCIVFKYLYSALQQ